MNRRQSGAMHECLFFQYVQPLVQLNGFQRGTISKRLRSDGFYRGGDLNDIQTDASVKGTGSDLFQFFGKLDPMQGNATAEGFRRKFGKAVGEIDGYQIYAVGEDALAKLGYRFRQRNALQSKARPSMVVIPSGRITVCRDLHSEKVLLFSTVTPWGITTFSRRTQPLKTLRPRV